jgi:hypothetical protein
MSASCATVETPRSPISPAIGTSNEVVSFINKSTYHRRMHEQHPKQVHYPEKNQVRGVAEVFDQIVHNSNYLRQRENQFCPLDH